MYGREIAFLPILCAFACTDGSQVADVADADGRPDHLAPEIGPPLADGSTRNGDSSAEAGLDAIGDDGSTDENETNDGPSSQVLNLFNGRDFDGWDSYLGPPDGSTQPVGLNVDPAAVFSIALVDGAPAIHVSGEIWGALTTRQEYENYHLRAEYRWGAHPVWPPLTARDGGLLYHSVGSFGAVQAGGGALAAPPGSGSFMVSMELQIADGDVGSYYALGPITIEGGAFSSAASSQQENPVGSWNTLDVFVVGNESMHVVNGYPVVHVRGATVVQSDGSRTPLARGRIQIQSESMEVYFRAITLETELRRIPSQLLDASPDR